MSELLLELFSEEIPARMQARAADDLARLLTEALVQVSPAGIRTLFGPRRIAFAADISAGVAADSTTERGPRASAPEQAVAGAVKSMGNVSGLFPLKSALCTVHVSVFPGPQPPGQL